MSPFSLSTVLALVGSAGLVAADGLHARARATGRYFGTAMSGTIMNDAAAFAIGQNLDDFGQYTCENEMKWDATEKSRGSFSFDRADAIVAAADKGGQMMRCHTLVWHSQLPSWVKNGGFDKATLISIMEEHIKKVVTHFKGKCYAWDVVNEALNEDGSLRNSVFLSTIGEEYIPLAFAAAAAADPDAKLYYNDYNCDVPGRKSDGARKLIKMVQDSGNRIDGMGMQAHLTVGKVDSQKLLENMRAFAGLGIDTSYTELDINTQSTSSFGQQADDYAAVAGVCLAVDRCVGITVWGITDKYSWRKPGLPLLWDSSLRKKEAYGATLDALGSS